MKRTLLLLCLLLSLGGTARAQKVLHLGRYAEANAALPAPEGARIVLYGDSITDGWASQRPEFFERTGFIGRGISGEVTAQMLLRYQPDVIDLHPETVVILAGINDIAQNLGDAYDEDNTFNNIKSMAQLALHHGIRVVLCAVLPSVRCYWHPEIEDVPEKVASLNARLRAYAQANGIPYADYYTALAGEDGRTIREEYSKDTVHPNAAGYARMERVLLDILSQ